MNPIQQISLKLQMGIHPSTDIQPEMLRAMWRELSRQRYKTLVARPSNEEHNPFNTSHPSLSRAD